MSDISEFEKPYSPQEKEDAMYDLWLKSGYFNPDALPGERTEPYTIILPPPNVTGTLHLGHAMYTVQDILVRFWRMRGKKALWLPGTDHAAIATQEKVEREIYKKEKKNRHDLGREEFLTRVEAFAQDSHDTIINQLQKMGFSLDWSREAYTLDEPRSLAVRTAFKRMYDAGLIYRGHRIVNWDPKMQSTVSDDELEWKEETVPFYYLKYGPFTIGTARPETKFGDKYVVMHPDDERYKEYTDGQKIELEWINGPITATIIKDTAIDREFGTGVMTITPWHDATDFDIAERHNLDKDQIIDYYGKLLPIAGEAFTGMKIKEAREKIIEKLQEKGLVEKIDENYEHRISVSSRGGGTIEPQIMEQWFVDVNKPFTLPHSDMEGIPAGAETTLKNIMRTVVETKQIQIVPERFEKTYFSWINNLRDWCISRQIWFGHRIPVWYCECGETIVSIDAPTACNRCKNAKEIVFNKTHPEAEKRKSIIAYVESFDGSKILTINWGDRLGGKLLVGGGLKDGEDPISCALRELTEETGYTDIEFIEALPQKITHNYFAASKNTWRSITITALKFRLRSQNRVEPQLEQDEKGKFSVEWNTKDTLRTDIKDLAHSYVLRTFAGLEPILTQDPDTLDTWFSSGLWTFSTLGWPEKTEDLNLYHPTDVLETGYDIIFFWVARMILMSGFHMGSIPFHTVYFHGLVRDAKGQKMSKSIGNIIDPLDMAVKYGADATRLSLIIGNGPGNDLRMSEDKIRGYRNFANKIWNASRFVLSAREHVPFLENTPLTKKDAEILNELHALTKEVTEDIESYKLYLAAEKLYHYFWHTFADTIIEEAKPRLLGDNTEERASATYMLYEVLVTLLKLLHPFMPFVTEAIWQHIPKQGKDLLLVEPWPN